MSLQVWLPLNGNLNNQGLNDITFTNEGNISVDTSGKIGSCYSRATKQTSGRVISNSKVLFDKSISICCWAYVSDCVGDAANGLVTIHSHDHNSNVGITVKQYSSTDYRISCNTGTGSDRTYKSYYGTTNIKNKWSHLTLTYDSISKILKLYVNGNCEYTLNNYINYSISDNIILFDWSTTYNNPSYRPACKLNDVRIYDHCLSAKEVKEISKGLCLHYKLADPYIESTTNLYSGWSTNCYNGATNKYNYGTSTDVYYDNLDGIIRVRMGTNNLDAWPYVFFNNITPPSNGEYRTLSFDYYPTIKDKVNFYTYNTSGTITWITNGVKGTGDNIPVNTNSWNHISVTIKNTGSSDSGYGYMRIGLEKHTSNTSNYWLFKNVQVEDKDHSTPFVVGSRNESTVYDCSGLANNGTKIGGVTPSSNPLPIRYDKSYDFDGNTGSIQIPNLSTLVPSGEFTMNCWIYHDDTWSSKGFETILGGPSGFELEAKNRSTNSPALWAYSWGQGSAAYELNKWNMITMTRNASETKFYINGELKITGSAGTIPSGNYFIGAWNTSSQQNYKGKISDFRLYSTVLSTEDIKTLYNTSASIDKNGNMYAYEFKEE